MSCQVPVAPAPPALKDLPKVAGDLKSELEGFKTDKLKNADTQEKLCYLARKVFIRFYIYFRIYTDSAVSSIMG